MSSLKHCCPLQTMSINKKQMGIRFSLKDYLTLVDETGRVLRDDKRGAINAKSINILARLHISDDSWLKLTSDFEGIFLLVQ